MELDAMVIQELPEVSGVSKAGNPWKKREWIVETFGAYPKKVKIQVFGEQRCANFHLANGGKYRFQLDAESREFNGRWYTDLSAYQYTPLEEAPAAAAPAGGYAAPAAPQAPAGGFTAPAAPADPFAGSADASDDLPF